MTGSRSSCASAFWRSAIALALVACAREHAPQGTLVDAASATAVDPAAADAVAATGAPPDAARASGVASPDSLPAYASAAPVGGKSVGHTSVVFKLKLEGDLAAAYKPRST